MNLEGSESLRKIVEENTPWEVKPEWSRLDTNVTRGTELETQWGKAHRRGGWLRTELERRKVAWGFGICLGLDSSPKPSPAEGRRADATRKERQAAEEGHVTEVLSTVGGWSSVPPGTLRGTRSRAHLRQPATSEVGLGGVALVPAALLRSPCHLRKLEGVAKGQTLKFSQCSLCIWSRTRRFYVHSLHLQKQSSKGCMILSFIQEELF